MAVQDEKDKIDLTSITKRIKRFRAKFSYKKYMNKKYIDRFEKISADLSSILPCHLDPSLFEIDDLIFGQPAVISTATQIEPISKSLIESFFDLFSHYQYHVEKGQMQHCFMAYLQLIDILPKKIVQSDIVYVFGCATMFLCGLNAIGVCQAIKILKVVIKYKELFEWFEYDGDETAVYRLLNLKNIHQPRHSDKMRIATWLTNQTATIIPEYMTLYRFKSYKEKIAIPYELLEQEKLMKYMKIFTSCIGYYGNEYMKFQNNNLFDYFMSARNENDKLKRIKCFFVACFKASEGVERIDFPVSSFRYFTLNKMSSKHRFAVYISNLVLDFHEYLDDIKRFKSICENMEKFDKYYPYTFEPYLSNTNDSPTDFESQNCHRSYNFNNYEDNENISNEPDLTFEKFFFYDELMKKIHVLNILVTAFRNCTDLLKSRGIDESDEGVIFRKRETPVMKYIKQHLIKPTKRKRLEWRYEIVMAKCPFLFFTKYQESLMGTLIKYLKGDKVDEQTLEEIYFALNPFMG